MQPIRMLRGYPLSSDYQRLTLLAREQGVVCLVDHGHDGQASRDIAQTKYRRHDDGTEEFEIFARGIAYINALNEAEFVEQCTLYHVEFLPPATEPLALAGHTSVSDQTGVLTASEALQMMLRAQFGELDEMPDETKNVIDACASVFLECPEAWAAYKTLIDATIAGHLSAYSVQPH